MYTLFDNIQTGYGANSASYPMGAVELPKGINQLKPGADNLLRNRAEVKNARATCIQSSKTSRPAIAPKKLPIQWLLGNFPKGLSGQSEGLTIYYALWLRSKILQLHVYSPRQLLDRVWRQKCFLSNGCRKITQGHKAAKACGCQFTTA
jgi:hypothetical protein